MHLIEMTRSIKPDFKIYVGAEESILPALMMGANGCVTGLSSVLPELVVGIYESYCKKDYALSRELQFAALPLIRRLLSLNFPQGYKEALSLRGMCMGPAKQSLPTAELDRIAQTKNDIKEIMSYILSRYFPGNQLVVAKPF